MVPPSSAESSFSRRGARVFSMVTAEACGRSRRFIESKTESEKEWSSDVPGRDEGSSAGAPPPSHLSVQFLESRRRGEACGYNYCTGQ